MTPRLIGSFAVGAATLMLGGVLSVSAGAQEKSIWDGVYTDAQAARGAAIYKEKCARCHGDNLGGNADSPALVGGEFLGNWGNQQLVALYDRIRISMPDDAKGSLSRAEVADSVAVILKGNEVPAGKTEVPTDAAALGAIKILSTKP